ncbi:hypothetical protein HXA31_20180 [Salipaludibacillus agaradhaerens]|jgi:hypothetical protein|uniref:hypothetical protein n=1 Tax=Salipaludibacillus TaxID=1884449 RepID=UPI0020D1F25C|nr:MULTISPECIES: hypothetical protein [Salipaludibacillus]MCR6116649.1 hypothetical protein [Salipaludibacillus agaradhaerens]UTR13474.1 hypothetical protein MM221_12635 [Salipaludibacillus sp. LMS25]
MFSEILSLFGGGAAVLAALVFIGKIIIEKKVDSKFKNELENHKQSLRVINEETKHDYKKKIHSFTLFATERHAVYPYLYKHLLSVKWKVFNLRGINKVLTFEEYNQQDIQNYMQSKKVPKGEVEEILKLWKTDKPCAVERLRNYLRMLDYQDAEYELYVCFAKYYESDLFLSEKVSNKIDSFLIKLRKLYNNYRYPDEETIIENTQIRDELELLQEEIKKTMKTELSVEV